MLWFLYLPFVLIVSIICYITNPIVILFCDKNGDLPGFLKYWQTWDDSCDAEYFMDNVCPSWLNYGFHEKYDTYHLLIGGKDAMRSKLKDGITFTTKERIQRYFCRLWWLTRNCAYGWTYFFFGAEIDHSDIEEMICEKDYTYINTEKYWMIKDDRKILGPLYKKHFLGWKMGVYKEKTKCMYACRISFALKFDNEEI